MFDRMLHPWKHPDRPAIAWDFEPFPRVTHCWGAAREAAARIRGAWRVLRHGVPEPEVDW